MKYLCTPLGPSLGLALSFVTAASVSAINYTESANGELSAAGNAPTAIVFSLGENTISGRMGSGAVTAGQTDADIFTFTIGLGELLTSINVTQFNPNGAVGSGSFLAISSGTSIDQASAMTHLSNVLVPSTGEYLDDLAREKRFTTGFGSPAGASTLSNPVGPGTYTLWFQEAGRTAVDYTLSLTVVPEPSTYALGGLGLALFAWLRRQRR